MKPFDLEAAKRGEPIVYAPHNEPVSLFIGVTSNGRVVYQTEAGGSLVFIQPPHLMAMAPRKVVKWVNLYRDASSGDLRVGWPRLDTEAEARRLGAHSEYIGTAQVELGRMSIAEQMREAADHIEALESHVAVLEALRPVWSVSAQVTAGALSQVWQTLGVKNQTEAMIKLRQLTGAQT